MEYGSEIMYTNERSVWHKTNHKAIPERTSGSQGKVMTDLKTDSVQTFGKHDMQQMENKQQN